MFIDKSQSYLRYKELWYLAMLKEDFEDTKGVLSIRKSKKDTQHNGQKKKYKRTNNDLQNIHIKTKDRVTRTPLKIGGESQIVCFTNEKKHRLIRMQ